MVFPALETSAATSGGGPRTTTSSTGAKSRRRPLTTERMEGTRATGRPWTMEEVLSYRLLEAPERARRFVLLIADASCMLAKAAPLLATVEL
jgi:hypothetical protein